VNHEPRTMLTPGWRNWQTRETQNLVEPGSVGVRLPLPAPFRYMLDSRTGELPWKVGFAARLLVRTCAVRRHGRLPLGLGPQNKLSSLSDIPIPRATVYLPLADNSPWFTSPSPRALSPGSATRAFRSGRRRCGRERAPSRVGASPPPSRPLPPAARLNGSDFPDRTAPI
jgi:hypothetical protein